MIFRISHGAVARFRASVALALALILASGLWVVPAYAQSRDVEESLSLRDDDAENGLTLSAGIDFSTGHYGEVDSTDILIVPINLRLRTSDRFSISVSMPYVRISGSNVVLGPDGTPLPGLPTARSVRSGIGDVSLSGTYALLAGDGPWMVDVTARVKLPTSSRARGLSTGKTDFSTSAEVTYVTGQWAPFASIGYRLPGKLAGAGLRNSLTTSVGTSWISGKHAVILSYDYEQAISPLSEDGHSLFLAYSLPASKALRVTLYSIAGLSQGSPAIEGGLLLSMRL